MKKVLKYQTRGQRILREPETVVTTILSHFENKTQNNSIVNWQEYRINIFAL